MSGLQDPTIRKPSRTSVQTRVLALSAEEGLTLAVTWIQIKRAFTELTIYFYSSNLLDLAPPNSRGTPAGHGTQAEHGTPIELKWCMNATEHHHVLLPIRILARRYDERRGKFPPSPPWLFHTHADTFPPNPTILIPIPVINTSYYPFRLYVLMLLVHDSLERTECNTNQGLLASVTTLIHFKDVTIHPVPWNSGAVKRITGRGQNMRRVPRKDRDLHEDRHRPRRFARNIAVLRSKQMVGILDSALLKTKPHLVKHIIIIVPSLPGIPSPADMSSFVLSSSSVFPWNRQRRAVLEDISQVRGIVLLISIKRDSFRSQDLTARPMPNDEVSLNISRTNDWLDVGLTSDVLQQREEVAGLTDGGWH
uniref:Uncharacterized protein n=1 Tax=Timema bartmani TaxID=61472 RepID=A0A7R9F0W6_9NEOP|nr:unnamed protein product [Timema bartmani]